MPVLRAESVEKAFRRGLRDRDQRRRLLISAVAFATLLLRAADRRPGLAARPLLAVIVLLRRSLSGR